LATAAEDGSSGGVLLVVGLGNPGIEYQFTPHNAGFLAVDRIADQHGAQVANRRCRALTAKIQIAGREVILAKPETFMNLSGLSVAALAAEFEIDPARELLVLYDELDLPLGVIRVRERGSAAGHNGARSISGALRSDEWARIRIGVGSNGEAEEAFRRGKDYLLTPMRKRDLAALDEVLERVAQAVDMVAAKGISAAMNEFNRRDASPAE
jgi:PTH1 family peptidyl-tRNA hydrolase